MRIAGVGVAALALALVAALSVSVPATSENDKLPPGMEYKKVGNSKAIVPIGTDVKREGDLRVLEGTGEYTARRFVEFDTRCAKMESEIAALRTEVEGLKGKIVEPQRPKLDSK